MSKSTEARWVQRFDHYQKALEQLTDAVALSKKRPLSNLEKQGLIQGFEYTHELAWNVMKDYFEFQGATAVMGARDASREAFQKGLIIDGNGWMEMLKSRNMTSHTYNQDTADDIVGKIVGSYHQLFCELRLKLQEIKNRG